jgi:hypothetical protein
MMTTTAPGSWCRSLTECPGLPVTLLIEVENIRSWFYPTSIEFQFGRKLIAMVTARSR